MSVGQTRPSRPMRSEEPQTPQPPDKRQNWTLVFFTLLLFGGALLLLGTASGWLGFKLGERQYSAAVTQTMEVYLSAQFAQAVEDITAGNYELARERLQYILIENPNYGPALDLLIDVEVVLGVTTTPTAIPPTATPSPTPDLRPVEQQYDSIIQMISLGEWYQALDMLANLRKSHPEYKIVEVDGLVYISLRNRGIQKILTGDLESGIYDFTLAEQFGPLDGETENYRNWARLYLLGNAFWGAYPEQAAYYYGQLVSAAPNITDSSGVSAFYRYWASLLQIGDELAKEEEWCLASEQMTTVLGAWDQAYVQPTATWIFNQCLKLTPSVTPTPTITPTIDLTLQVTPTFTPSPTLEGLTNTPLTPSNTPATPSNTPATPSNTPVTPSNTPVTPSNTPVTPSNTPEETPTDTLVP